MLSTRLRSSRCLPRSLANAAMDALIELRATNDIDPEEVTEVEIGLPETGWKIIGDPEEAKHAPTGVVDGQFSMPFCAAVTLREGGMVWDDYARHIGDEKTLDLTRRVHTAPDPKAEAEFPDVTAGSIGTCKGQGLAGLHAGPRGRPLQD